MTVVQGNEDFVGPLTTLTGQHWRHYHHRQSSQQRRVLRNGGGGGVGGGGVGGSLLEPDRMDRVRNQRRQSQP